ncbi:hypothetical protein BDA96_04G236400 [Sorghum bicolor]|uniref:Uncharacterized protein n=2 Tax=Sorghum bicolor TaxID=4558 RepID=A0A921R4I3_SORBI|nr:hypothetical protein BDA96_04G236400 [Sorghum bicolor]OQU85351.1 hypothetical protein SORBI_3004G222150 [Sorghum bicolor]
MLLDFFCSFVLTRVVLQEFFEDKFICYTLDLLAEQEQKLLISLYTRLSKLNHIGWLYML